MIIIGKYVNGTEIYYTESDEPIYEYAIVQIKDELESMTGDIVAVDDIEFYESRPLRVTSFTTYHIE